jgi:hypothetical protein
MPPMESVRVPGFSPSVHGLRFANAFPSAPIRRFQLGALATLTIGDVANGLCGGMTFVAADCFNAGLDAPTDAAAPPEGSALRSAIIERQFDSFDGGRVPLRFYGLALPIRPPRETGWGRALGRVGIDLHSRTWLMATREWPRVRRLLDAGRLVPIGLVRAVSWNPLDLARNHQVLAWGYDLDGGRLTLRIYDPNWPADDEVTLTIDVDDPDGEARPVYSKADGPVVAFFKAPYRFRVPAVAGPPSGQLGA